MSQIEFGMAASVTGRVDSVKVRKWKRQQRRQEVVTLMQSWRLLAVEERRQAWITGRTLAQWWV